MSNNCPLCGNSKQENSIFCDNCKNKIENEYEVEVSENNTSDTEEVNIESNKSNIKDTQRTEYISEHTTQRKVRTSKPRSSIRALYIILTLGVVSTFAFFYYKNVVIHGNLEKSKWNEAIKSNSIEGYLEYMVEFPKGKNYIFAEDALMSLKKGESESYEILQQSENSIELIEFMNKFPNSAYNSLIKKRLDSLTWSSTVKDNTKESYKKYIESFSDGYYINNAIENLNLLTQSYPVSNTELDSIKLVLDGFFVALSSINAENLKKYLAPKVYQFFNLGSGTKERIVGDLLISGSKSQSPTINFIPDINGITYEKTLIEHYKINVPLQKSITNSNGSVSNIYGFIVQIELDNNLQIVAISELSPSLI